MNKLSSLEHEEGGEGPPVGKKGRVRTSGKTASFAAADGTAQAAREASAPGAMEFESAEEAA